MRPRVSPSFVVAVAALVVASAGTGYAAAKITSNDIKDGAVQSRDVRDGSLQGRDVKDRSLTGRDVRDRSLSGADLAERSILRSRLAKGCAAGEAAAFGGCVRLAAFGPSSHQAAIDDCNRRNGRLPTTMEIRWIANHDEYGWADGNPDNYEFSGDSLDEPPYTPLAFNRYGGGISNASAQLFWHHCVTY